MEPAVHGARVARNAAWNLAGLVTPLVVAFVTLPILIGALGTEGFGVLAIVWMILTYLAELGFGSTTTRYAAEAVGAGRFGEVGAIAWTTAGLQAAIGVVEGVVLAAATPWIVGSVLDIPEPLAGAARGCLYLLAAAIPMVGLGRSFRGLVEAAQRFDLALAVHVPATAGGYIAATVAAVAGWPLPAVFGLILASKIVTFPAYYLLARRALPGVSLRPGWHRSGFRELVGFAGWVAVSTVVSPLLVYLDRFMVGALLTMTAVTFYAAPYEVVARLALIPGAIVGALYPALSQLSGRGDRERAEVLAARSTSMVVIILGPILVLMIGGAWDGLTLWLGPEYAERSALALQILAVGVLANAAAHVPFGLLQSAGRPDLPARFHLLELPLQLVLVWLLVSRYGITGAAMAWTARIILDAALLFAAAARLGLLRADVLVRSPLPGAVGGTALGAGAALVAMLLLDGLVARIAILLGIGAATALLLWGRGTTAYERRRLRGLLRPEGGPGGGAEGPR